MYYWSEGKKNQTQPENQNIIHKKSTKLMLHNHVVIRMNAQTAPVS